MTLAPEAIPQHLDERGARALLARRPRITRTYSVDPQTLAAIRLDTYPRLRALDAHEVITLAEYLESSVDELVGEFHVATIDCTRCERTLSFVDFAMTAVESGKHDRARLRDVLTGRAGAWLTVRGADGGRPVRCSPCGTLAPASGYSEYTSKTYAYA